MWVVTHQESLSAIELYPNHESLERRYGKPLFGLLWKYAPKEARASWMDYEDRLSEAWEAVYVVLLRHGDLTEPDFGNVVVRTVRNRLVNLEKRAARSRRVQGVYMGWSDVWADERDPYRAVELRMTFGQVRSRLRPGAREILDLLVGPFLPVVLSGEWVRVKELAMVAGRHPETVRARLRELRRVVGRHVG